MGKLLVIKDADFSANGMALGEQEDIASTITLTRGYNVNGPTTFNSRLGTADKLNLSSYISQGYTRLVATLLSPSAHSQCLKMVNSDESQEIRPSASYTTEPLSVDLTSSMPYLRYSTSKTSGDYSATSYNASTLARIVLVKY